MPHMYSYYNVTCIDDGNGLNRKSNLLARIINVLIKSITDIHKIPLYLMILLDANLLQFINHHNFGISHLIGSCLEWLMKNIDIVIDAKIEELWKRKPGALKLGELKIIWVSMAQRPFHIAKKGTFASTEKYNTILADLVGAMCPHHLFMQIRRSISSPTNYFNSGFLTNLGKDNFWMEVDWQLEEFDYSKIDLKPPTKMYYENHHQHKPAAHVRPFVKRSDMPHTLRRSQVPAARSAWPLWWKHWTLV